jgi:hypothetical protein
MDLLNLASLTISTRAHKAQVQVESLNKAPKILGSPAGLYFGKKKNPWKPNTYEEQSLPPALTRPYLVS